MAQFLKKKVFSIGGRPELIVYDDIEQVFAATELIPSGERTIMPVHNASPFVRVFFFGGATACDIPVDVPSPAHTVFEADDVRIAADGALRFGAWFGRAQTVVHRDSKVAVIVVPGLKGLNKDFISRYLFRPILDELLCGIGYIPLHAAGVTAGGGGCIIAGPAGSGKTSLLYGLIGNGFGFLADDRILIRKEPDTPVLMYSFSEYIRLAVNPRRPKRLISPPDAPVKRTGVRYVLFLQGPASGQKTELRPAGAAEAAAMLLHFVSRVPVNTDHAVRQKAFGMIGDILEHAKAFRLSGWGSRQHWVSLVSGLLRSDNER